MKTRKPWKRWRSAITGRYVSKAYAEAHPDVTISETVQPKEREAHEDK